jgi:cell division septation protein DedD
VALAVLGLTTAVSLVGYWIWLRPLYVTAVLLPTVPRPATAATTLGPLILHASTGRATPATPPVAATTVAAPAASGGRWAIQAGAFSTTERAGVVVRQLEGQGYPAFQREQAFARERYQVAFAGPYASREDGERALGALRRVPGFEGSLLRPLPTP